MHANMNTLIHFYAYSIRIKERNRKKSERTSEIIYRVLSNKFQIVKAQLSQKKKKIFKDNRSMFYFKFSFVSRITSILKLIPF